LAVSRLVIWRNFIWLFGQISSSLINRLSSWKEYIPGDFICVVVTSEYKVLRKVSVTQPNDWGLVRVIIHKCAIAYDMSLVRLRKKAGRAVVGSPC
jgi:hypothetical protein